MMIHRAPGKLAALELAFVLFLSSVGISACHTATTFRVGGNFHRHPVLAGLYPEKPSGKSIYWNLRPRKKTIRGRGLHFRFRHPVLNLWTDTDGNEKQRASRFILDPLRVEEGVRIASIASKLLSSYRQQPPRRMDCSGFIFSVLEKAGYEPRRAIPAGARYGTEALFLWLERRNRIHHRKIPMVGDLVFFDNTYDRNRDGRPNDPLTHVGIVERVMADGTVVFIHKVKRGILRYRMNLLRPHLRRDPANGRPLNNYLRQGAGPRRLAAELFHAFGTVVR